MKDGMIIAAFSLGLAIYVGVSEARVGLLESQLQDQRYIAATYRGAMKEMADGDLECLRRLNEIGQNAAVQAHTMSKQRGFTDSLSKLVTSPECLPLVENVTHGLAGAINFSCALTNAPGMNICTDCPDSP